jgi:DNA polymerase-3 subunit gamma/tau
VKFIFATTEIRKVPITVLSRCQRFDLRRISAADLVGLFTTILEKEGVPAEQEALAMIARAAEGSARDGLSLLDQSIAHGGGSVHADTVRGMLGLADRARIVDLFEHIVKGDITAALSEFNAQYEAGANPVVVLTDLADFTHLVTRFKYIPEAADDPSLSEVERVRGREFSENVAVSALSRIWQMLLKGIPEAEGSSRPAGAAEMVLIRLTHAASLPSPEDAARRLADFANSDGQPMPNAGGGNDGGRGTQMAQQTTVNARGFDGGGQRAPSGGPTAMLQAVPNTTPREMPVGRIEERPSERPEPKVAVRSLHDVVDLCTENRDPRLKALVRNFVRLVKIEPGRLDIRMTDGGPGTLPGELGVKLKEWTGIHWIVTLSKDEGEPTLVEADASAREARMTDARADPDVAAILSQFPGAKITDVRIRVLEEDNEVEDAPAPAIVESAEGDILPGDDIEL